MPLDRIAAVHPALGTIGGQTLGHVDRAADDREIKTGTAGKGTPEDLAGAQPHAQIHLTAGGRECQPAPAQPKKVRVQLQGRPSRRRGILPGMRREQGESTIACELADHTAMPRDILHEKPEKIAEKTAKQLQRELFRQQRRVADIGKKHHSLVHRANAFRPALGNGKRRGRLGPQILLQQCVFGLSSHCHLPALGTALPPPFNSGKAYEKRIEYHR